MKPYYYIYRVGHKGPNVKHPTLLSATKEAERLSCQHPGETFEILQCLGFTRTATAQTFWMDGVTPPTSGGTDEDGWIEHKPGDPMPCDGKAIIDTKHPSGGEVINQEAKFWQRGFSDWWKDGEITAWRPSR
jgi:hypothetical protein